MIMILVITYKTHWSAFNVQEVCNGLMRQDVNYCDYLHILSIII